MLHKTCDLLVQQRTMLINGLRGHLAEFGITAAKGPCGAKAATEAPHEAQEQLLGAARVATHTIAEQLRQLAGAIERLEARTVAWRRISDVSRRLLLPASDAQPERRETDLPASTGSWRS